MIKLNGNNTLLYRLAAGVILASLSVLHNIFTGVTTSSEWLTIEMWNSAKMMLATFTGYAIGKARK